MKSTIDDRVFVDNRNVTGWYLDNIKQFGNINRYYNAIIVNNFTKEKCCVCDKTPKYVKLAPKCRCVYHIECYNKLDGMYCKGCGEYI